MNTRIKSPIINNTTFTALRSALRTAATLNKLNSSITEKFKFPAKVVPASIENIFIKTFADKKDTNVVYSTSETEDIYAIVPWNTKDEVVNLVSKVCGSQVKSILIELKLNAVNEEAVIIDDKLDNDTNLNLSFCTTASQRSNNLSFVNRQLGEAFDGLHFRDQEINNLKNRVEALENSVRNKDTEINNINNNVTTFRNSCTTKDNSINDLNTQVRNLNATITTKDDSIKNLQNQITNLNATITNQTNQINTYANQVQNLNASATAKDTQINNLTTQINNTKVTILVPKGAAIGQCNEYGIEVKNVAFARVCSNTPVHWQVSGI